MSTAKADRKIHFASVDQCWTARGCRRAAKCYSFTNDELMLFYHRGLTAARNHLQELGAPEPKLPPFDELKFEPLPDVELNPKDEFWVDPAMLDS